MRQRSLIAMALLVGLALSPTARADDTSRIVTQAEDAAQRARQAAERGYEAERLAEQAAARAVEAAERANSLPKARIQHIAYSEGDYYGEVRNDEPDGYGVFIYSTNDRYEGQFRNGLFHGYGVVNYLAEDAYKGDRYEGQFIDDTAQGYGLYRFLSPGDGQGSRYAGEIDDWALQTHGVYRYGSGSYEGTVAAGQFVDGHNNGYAVFTYAGNNDLAGDRYEGAVADDLAEGWGIYYAREGTALHAMWHDDLPDDRQSVVLDVDGSVSSQSVAGGNGMGGNTGSMAMGGSSSSSSSGAGSGTVTYGGSGSGEVTPPSGGDSTTAMVRTAQEMLSELGYTVGSIDGVIGAQTRSAIIAFQNDMGLTPSGQVDDVLLIALRTASTMIARMGRLPGAETQRNENLELMATGTGFHVSEDGFVTNQHVVDGCTEVRLRDLGTATVVAADANNDLAYLTIADDSDMPIAVFRSSPKVARGETVVAIGYPLHGTLASQGNVTVGTISALAGYNDDFREFQFSAPIQPGNSGGPLLDRSGHVVGIVSSELVSEIAEEVPQNVNFAIKAQIVVAFLGAQGIDPQVAASTEELDVEDVADLAEDYTLLVECWADPSRYY